MNKIITKIITNKIIVIIITVILVILFAIFLSKNINRSISNKKGLYSHNEKGIVKDEMHNGLKFTNISMTTEKGYTTFKATVINEGKKDYTNDRIYINILDKKENTIIKLLGYIPGGLKKGESKQITANAKGDLKKAYSKEIVDYFIENKDGN